MESIQASARQTKQMFRSWHISRCWQTLTQLFGTVFYGVVFSCIATATNHSGFDGYAGKSGAINSDNKSRAAAEKEAKQ